MRTKLFCALFVLICTAGYAEQTAAKNPVELNNRLLTAAENGSLDEAAQLLKQGADVNAAGDNSMTPLMLASRAGNTEIVSLLIKNKADLNAQSEIMGFTALHYAVSKKNPGIVQLLLNAGAQVKTNPDDKDLLVLAVETGDPAVLKMLIKAGLDPMKKINGYQGAANTTLLMIAAYSGTAEAGKVLIDAGVDVNAVDGFGDPALNWAAYYNQPSIVPLLIEKKSKLNVTGYAGRTALDHAIAQKGSPELIDLLKKAGCLSAKDLK